MRALALFALLLLAVLMLIGCLDRGCAVRDAAALLDAGVDGYITKTTLGADLPELVRQTYVGARPVSPDVAAYLLDIDEDIIEQVQQAIEDADPAVTSGVVAAVSFTNWTPLSSRISSWR